MHVYVCNLLACITVNLESGSAFIREVLDFSSRVACLVCWSNWQPEDD
jgi:hypothetical protein